MSLASKLTAPELRFPEFEGEWQLSRLGNFIEEYREKSVVQDQHEVLTSSRSGLIRQREYYDNGRITDRNNVGFNVLPNGYMTYRSRSDDRRFYFNENDLGVVGIVSIYYPVFKFKDGDNVFFKYLFSIKTHLLGKFSVGTSQTVLSMNELKAIKLRLPALPEQKKIAGFLKTIDEKLKLLRRKHALLADYKLGVMQQLFSQKLRFKRNDGRDFPEWVRKKLGDISYVEMGHSPPSESYNDKRQGVPLIQGNADLSEGKSNPRRYTTAPTTMCEPGDTIISVRAPVGDIGRSLHKACIGRGVALVRSTKHSDQEFLRQFLLWHKAKWLRIAQGSTFSAISGSDIRRVSLLVPHPDEQRKIAHFLYAMDQKIENLSATINQTDAFKKGLLQRMLV